MTDFSQLRKEQYILLTSFRKDGTGVGTPVWFASEADAIVLWTVTDSWKVKRIRRNSRVTVAACDLRGNQTGEPIDGTAELLDSAETESTRALITKKYGILGRITMFGSRIRRGTDGTIGIRVRPLTT